ncbi:MAG: MFS transporter [Actinomycetes bacterium]
MLGLGTVWILDGLEVTIVGAIAGRLTEDGSGITISESQIGIAAGVYVAGACLGALFFGYLADRIGRKKLFIITLAVYLVATVATAFSTTPMFFYVCRFFTGAGIGGEYAAINSAIDELIPARVRGRVDLIINGSFWLGTAFGAALSVFLLNENFFAKDLGWRLAFGLGAIFGLCILIVRRYVPESPRWMFIHGKEDQAEESLEGVDEDITVRQRKSIGFGQIAKTMVTLYPKRSALGLALFIGQAFLYNAVFFTFALVLTNILKVDAAIAPWYLIPLAIGNFLGPLLLGRFFDTAGRKVMITLTNVLSGLLLILTGVLFKNDSLSATTLTLMWCIVFFFASAGASAAYPTVSEIFPMESRAMAIAFFYAIGTGVGGIVGPIYFGKLIEQGRDGIVTGYYVGASLMIAAGLVELVLGVAAAQRWLEDIATPLTGEEGDQREPARAGADDMRSGRR